MTIVEHEPQVEVSERERQARVLEAAALELDVRGWSRGAMERDDGTVCLVGAMHHALSTRLSESYRMAKWLLTGDRFSTIPIRFNDTLATGAGDVKFVLRWRAAEVRDGR